MKNILFIWFALSIFSLVPAEVSSQTYTTESKKCGACKKKVSNNSRVGMRCPHCGVEWGRENTSYDQRSTFSFPNSSAITQFYSGGTCISSKNVNLRSGPSTSRSKITTIPAYTQLTIISVLDNWLYVSYRYYNGYSYSTTNGYVYKKLFY